jgi:hypothetical protein
MPELYRGKDKVNMQWLLYCLVHNPDHAWLELSRRLGHASRTGETSGASESNDADYASSVSKASARLPLKGCKC